MSFGEKAFWNNIVVSGGVANGIYAGIRLDPYEAALTSVNAPEPVLTLISALSALSMLFLVLYAMDFARLFGLIGIGVGYVSGYFLGAGEVETGVLMLLVALGWTLFASAWAEEHGW